MIRFLIRLGIYIVAVAIGLVVASLVVDGLSIDATSFIVVVLIFALLQALLSPLITQLTDRNASVLAGAAGLISTFLALFITSIISDGLDVDGASAWFLSAVIIWLVTLVATFLLPFLLVKMGLEKARDRRS